MKERHKRPAGWRTLHVGELELWWTVGAPRVTAKLASDGAPLQAITLTLTVERADRSGKKLVAKLHGYRGLAIPAAGFRDVQSIAVEPSTVRRLVDLAAPRGAWPSGSGTVQTEIEVTQRPLPDDLTFRPEHLDGLTVVWKK